MVDHWLSNLPQITLNGRPFYVRSDSMGMRPVNKQVQDAYTISGKRRRAVLNMEAQWEYTVACRSNYDRDFLVALVNNASYQSYTVTFQDGFTEASYNVTIDIGQATPVMDNLYAWDIPITLMEWA